MRRLRDLSFRYKIPLRGILLALITALLLTATFLYQEYYDLRQDLVTTSGNLARVLANTLVTPFVQDDVWRAYEIINSPFTTGARDGSPYTAELIMLLDADRRVYLATDPKQYPMLSDPGRANPDFYELWQAVERIRDVETRVVELTGSSKLYVVTPIVSDGVRLGTLVMGYSKNAFVPRFIGIAKGVGLAMLVTLAILLPASWYWAQRFARPLTDLASTMGRIGPSIPDPAEVKLYESRDEIGQLGAAFKAMLQGLRDKEALEKEIVFSERLAAIGRLAAGAAHEINNPLGGMLNAISTFKHHGNDDPLTARTLSLIERGLLQIKDTMSALLVEAKAQSHPLTRQDIEDTRTLVLADLHRKSAQLEWTNEVGDRAIALPSTLVRQALINLMLNAIQAIEAGGRVGCRIGVEDSALQIAVSNDGAYIAQEKMEHLFEPFAAGRESGHGLGLWVTWQIARQLRGNIIAESEPGNTRFTVTLPLGDSPA
jgi:two-component system NtrC family sensor kinase